MSILVSEKLSSGITSFGEHTCSPMKCTQETIYQEMSVYNA